MNDRGAEDKAQAEPKPAPPAPVDPEATVILDPADAAAALAAAAAAARSTLPPPAKPVGTLPGRGFGDAEALRSDNNAASIPPPKTRPATHRRGRWGVTSSAHAWGVAAWPRCIAPMILRSGAMWPSSSCTPRWPKTRSTARASCVRRVRLAGLSHPNIVVVHDVGEIEGRPYMAMELIDGEPLVGPAGPAQEAARPVRP